LITTLKAIHNANVIHGDIALQNLCLQSDGKATIIDFSHARSSTSRKLRQAEMATLNRIIGLEHNKPAQKRIKRESDEGNVRCSSRIKAMESTAQDVKQRRALQLRQK
jgi:tRNA A-37 threonylcarbamoyl transferase component Bud32